MKYFIPPKDFGCFNAVFLERSRTSIISFNKFSTPKFIIKVSIIASLARMKNFTQRNGLKTSKASRNFPKYKMFRKEKKQNQHFMNPNLHQLLKMKKRSSKKIFWPKKLNFLVSNLKKNIEETMRTKMKKMT